MPPLSDGPAGPPGAPPPPRTPGRRGTDLTLARAIEQAGAAAAHWKAIIALALVLYGLVSGCASVAASWVGYRTGVGPGRQLAEVRTLIAHNDSVAQLERRDLVTRVEIVAGRMDRVERIQTQMTQRQCVESRGRADAATWADCAREVKELLSQ